MSMSDAKPPEGTTDDELIWLVCPYLRQSQPGLDFESGCLHCPEWEEDERYGKVQRMCYGRAREVVNIVQTGDPWRNRANAK
jgi:hypothetical protein